MALTLVLVACTGAQGGDAPDASIRDSALNDVQPESVGCAPTPERDCDGWLALTRAEDWVRGDAETDPLSAHRPDSVRCDIAGFRVENAMLELDTGRCNYFWLRQPSLAQVAESDTVTVELRHYDLTSVQPAEAHFALTFEGRVVWETDVAIPAQANVIRVDVRAPRGLPLGEDVGLHLHNHGQNTWVFAGLWVHRGEL